MTKNNEATIETFFIPLTGNCPLVGLTLHFCLLRSTRTAVCLALRRGGQHLDPVDFRLMLIRISFSHLSHTYFQSRLWQTHILLHQSYSVAIRYQVLSTINNMYVARAGQYELQIRHMQTSLCSFPVTW